MKQEDSPGAEKSLLKNSLFREIPREKLEEITRSVSEERIAAGTVVFRQGDIGDKFYVIASGRVRVFRKDRQGVEMELSVLGPGESFGELALISGEPRSAHVETLEETRLIAFPKRLFLRILNDYPDISLAFMKQISTWLVDDVKIVEREVRKQYDRPRLSWFDIVLILGLSVLFGLIFNHSNPNGIPLVPKMPSSGAISRMDPQSVLEAAERGKILIVDAMPVNFYEKRHIRGAINLPPALFEIVYMMTLDGEDRDKQIVVYGRTISRPYDLEVADRLLNRGHRNVGILEGGLAEWEKRGYPTGP